MKYTANYIGKRKRINNIFNSDGKCVIVPLDDNLISGPTTGIVDISTKLQQIEKANPSAILAYQGTLANIEDTTIPRILNLTASTIRSCHTKKVLISNIEYALKMDADAVAVHINISSQYESHMLEILGKVSGACDTYGIPLLVIIYPRCESCDRNSLVQDENYLLLKETDNQKYTELISHCVRIAYEMGADIIKTQYTGSKESFDMVVKSANGCPVIIAGGDIMKVNDLFQMIEGAMVSGASGVSIGRNIFGRADSDIIIKCIKDIVFLNQTAEYVMQKYQEYERRKKR